jgi:hypothetical protein
MNAVKYTSNVGYYINISKCYSSHPHCTNTVRESWEIAAIVRNAIVLCVYEYY